MGPVCDLAVETVWYCFPIKCFILLERHRVKRAASFVPQGTKHVSCSLRRAFGAIKRFYSVLWETSMIRIATKTPVLAAVIRAIQAFCISISVMAGLVCWYKRCKTYGWSLKAEKKTGFSRHCGFAQMLSDPKAKWDPARQSAGVHSDARKFYLNCAVKGGQLSAKAQKVAPLTNVLKLLISHQSISEYANIFPAVYFSIQNRFKAFGHVYFS